MPQNGRVAVICGAGVGGLAMAHQLVKLSNNERESSRFSRIVVVERHAEVGGQARSSYDADGKYVEYCWHAFGGAYHNLLTMMGEVGLLDSALVPADRWVYEQGEHGQVIEQGKAKSFLADASVFKLVRTFLGLGVSLSSLLLHGDALRVARLLYRLNVPHDDEDDVTWASFVQCVRDDVLRSWLVGFPAIYLGMDAQRLSFGTVARLYRIIDTPPLREHDFLFPTGPINEVFLNPWKVWLEERGVEFFMQTTVADIATADRSSGSSPVTAVTLQGVQAQDSSPTSHIVIPLDTTNGDVLVNSLDCEAWNRLMPSPSMDKLCRNARMLQCQVLFELPEEVNFADAGSRPLPTITCHLETPWAIGCRLEFTSWDKEWVEREGHLISCGIGIWDAPGILWNKPAINCCPSELAQECWAQMVHFSPRLFCGEGSTDKTPSAGCPRTATGKTLEDIGYCDFRVFPYEWDEQAQTWITDEPTFSNNVGTFRLRPSVVDERRPNVLHVNSYAKRDPNMAVTRDGIVDLFCMETAAANAVAAVQSLLQSAENTAGLQALTNPPPESLPRPLSRPGISWEVICLFVLLTACCFSVMGYTEAACILAALSILSATNMMFPDSHSKLSRSSEAQHPGSIRFHLMGRIFCWALGLATSVCLL